MDDTTDRDSLSDAEDFPYTCLPAHRMCLDCHLSSPECLCPYSMSIHRAAELGQVNLVEDALAQDGGLTVNQPDAHGFTPIMLAAMEGHVAVVKVLDHHRSNLDLTAHMLPTDYCIRGCNALHLAAFNDHPEVCEYLISKGMDPDLLTTGLGSARSAMTGYGMSLNDNDPDFPEDFDPQERACLTDEEKAARVARLHHARCTFLRNRKRAATLLAKKDAQDAAKRKRAATLLAKQQLH
jgi:hypothetical protein